jgi:hypothetical protein
MPRIICERHGAQGAALVCTHIQQQVSQRLDIRDVKTVTANYDETPVWQVHLCSECAAGYGYSDRKSALAGDEGLDRIFAVDDQVPVCALCFNECRRTDEESS